ncbi:hypothetical protein T484DRAFT_1879491 [Baffinella frigidus]|nr:hypothetical protein T484DRAFT_1879491 [Cryptophyta sp. CCMP2293]
MPRVPAKVEIGRVGSAANIMCNGPSVPKAVRGVHADAALPVDILRERADSRSRLVARAVARQHPGRTPITGGFERGTAPYAPGSISAILVILAFSDFLTNQDAAASGHWLVSARVTGHADAEANCPRTRTMSTVALLDRLGDTATSARRSAKDASAMARSGANWKEKIGWSGYEYDEGACRQCKARSPEGVAAAAKAVADKAAADKAASEKAAAERAAAAKAAAEQVVAAREREAKAAAAKAAAQKAAAQKAATEKALLEKDLVPWFCAVGFHPADAFDLAMILLRNGVRVPGSALAQTDEHICRLLYQAGLPDGLAVQVPLLLEALRSVRASRSAVAATINPGQDVGDWLRADVGLDDVSATEIEAVFKADGVEMDSVGVILAQEEGEIEELVASLPVGVRLPLLEALRDVRAGRLKPRPDPASTRAVLEVVWCVTEEVAPWLTALPTMTPKGVSAVEAACHARGIRTKGCLLAQRSPALSEIMTQLPKGPQKPLQDAIRSARKAGLGWNVSGTPRDASAFEPTATLTTQRAVTWRSKRGADS